MSSRNRTAKRSTTLGVNQFPERRAVEAYGVRVGIAATNREALEILSNEITEILPEFQLTDYEDDKLDHRFFYRCNPSGRDTLYKNGTRLGPHDREFLLDRFRSEFRLTVAEYAVDRVFVHAGVVAWKGRAILIPARSFAGKTTLTAELVRRGAVYYSDEYAVLDSNGHVRPFAKKLSVRGEIDAYRQVDHPVEKFGGVAGTDPVPVGMILITEYKPNAKWNPKRLTRARGMMEVIKNTLPIRRDPRFTLNVLSELITSTSVIKTRRGEAEVAAANVIEYFEAYCLDGRAKHA